MQEKHYKTMNILHNETLKTVTLLTTSAAYVSSKRRLAKSIINIIETIPHGVYAKPFVGIGGIFFRQKRVPSVEIINDRSGDVVNFFCVATSLSAFYGSVAVPNLG